MRNFIEIINEAAKAKPEDPSLGEAGWWAQRWVTGSMTDDEWETDWLEHIHDATTAFELIQKELGVSSAVGLPLWRGITIPRRIAIEMKKTLFLPPHQFPFQSFTTDREVAVEFVEEIGLFGKNNTRIVVQAKPNNQQIMFALQDFNKKNKSALSRAMLGLEDWYHQKEVLVRITKPLPLLSVEIIL